MYVHVNDKITICCYNSSVFSSGVDEQGTTDGPYPCPPPSHSPFVGLWRDNFWVSIKFMILLGKRWQSVFGAFVCMYILVGEAECVMNGHWRFICCSGSHPDFAFAPLNIHHITSHHITTEHSWANEFIVLVYTRVKSVAVAVHENKSLCSWFWVRMICNAICDTLLLIRRSSVGAIKCASLGMASSS